MTVDLFFRDRRHLSGTIHGMPLEVTAELPVSRGTATGTYDGRDVRASWQVGSNYEVTEIDVSLDADFAGVPIMLAGTFTAANALWRFEKGTVTGTIDSQAVDITIRAQRNTPNPTGSVTIEGTLGAAVVNLSATSNNKESTITGSIDGEPVHLVSVSRSTRAPWMRQIAASGKHPAPALAALMAGALLYFRSN